MPLASVALKVMFCEVVTPVTGSGTEPSVSTGAVWSTVIEVVELPTLPLLSVICTVIVFKPAASVPVDQGEVHAANAPAFSLHWREAIVAPPATVALNVMFCAAVEPASGFGAAFTITSGTETSTVIDVVPVATLPALSVASTVIVFAPIASVPVGHGDVHAANAAAPSLQR